MDTQSPLPLASSSRNLSGLGPAVSRHSSLNTEATIEVAFSNGHHPTRSSSLSKSGSADTAPESGQKVPHNQSGRGTPPHGAASFGNPEPPPYGPDSDRSVLPNSPREASTVTQSTGRRRANTTRAAPSATTTRTIAKPVILQPQLPSQKLARLCSATALYFTSVPVNGPELALRAHTGTLVGDRIWFIGGVNAKHCQRDVVYYDTETLEWNTVETSGEQLPPLRAHSTNLVGDKLYIFGGGDGPTYSNEVWIFDTTTYRFSRPTLSTPKTGLPPPRRAHTTVLYLNFLVVFGGGNGQAALNDVWALDVSDSERLSWQEWTTKGNAPQRKGYHSANLVGAKMVVFGGSDGHASFADVHVLNLRTLTWTLLNTELKFNRLSHTSTLVGSYLFMLGGHNGQSYAQDVLLFNLVSLQWESRSPGGIPPTGRGYHTAVMHDSRIYVSGGFNGVTVFSDLWALELGASAYLPQVTTFEIDETAQS